MVNYEDNEMKISLSVCSNQVVLSLRPETPGEQRIVDYLVMSKPLREARNFDDVHGEIEFRVTHDGHESYQRVKELRLIRRGKNG